MLPTCSLTPSKVVGPPSPCLTPLHLNPPDCRCHPVTTLVTPFESLRPPPHCGHRYAGRIPLLSCLTPPFDGSCCVFFFAPVPGTCCYHSLPQPHPTQPHPVIFCLGHGGALFPLLQCSSDPTLRRLKCEPGISPTAPVPSSVCHVPARLNCLFSVHIATWHLFMLCKNVFSIALSPYPCGWT